MWSFPRGLSHLIQSLKSKLSGAIFAEGNVQKASRQGQSWKVETLDGKCWFGDALALTCPAYAQATICQNFDGELATALRSIPYNRIAVVALGFRSEDIHRPLNGFGYLSPQRERRDVLGVQWCSSIYPDRAPAGTVLLRAMCGGWSRAEIINWPDRQLVEAVRTDLACSLHLRAPPIFTQVIRWPRAIPQYHLGHLDKVAWIEKRAASHPGLFLGGNAFRGVALNDCVEQAGLLAHRLAKWRPTAGN
jgi:oxygen-dependent protoporphyrinogen oxidase